MAEKRIIGRAVQKHDIEANWLKATNFIPMQGEMIIYDIDANHSYERIKIGDGVQNVNTLPFYAGSWEDLSDRPFWSEGPTTVEWDGNTDGLTASSDGANYKVSDLKPSSTEVVGGKLTFSDGSIVEITSDIIETGGYIYSIYYGTVYVNTFNGSTYNASIDVTLSEPGIYFQKNTYNQLVSFAYGDETVYQLDEKYIPDTIARVSDIPEQIIDDALSDASTNPVQNKVVNEAISNLNTLVGDIAVSEQINTAISEIPVADNYKNGLMTSTDKKKLDTIESNAQKNVQSDWSQNDITSMEFVQNRPFYDGPLSITWDGVTKGHPAHMYDSSNYLIKITDTIFTDEELQAAKFVISENGTTTEVIVADVWEDRAYTDALTGIWYNSRPCVYVVRKAGTFVGPGTYFLYNYSSKIYIQSLTVGSDTDVKKIDEKYIPDSIARAAVTYTQAEVDELIAAIRNACMPKVTTVTLYTDEWTYGEGEYYYDVKLDCITSNSQVSLQADAASLAILQDDGAALVPVAYNTFVRIWTVGGSPREDLTVQITVQEVVEV